MKLTFSLGCNSAQTQLILSLNSSQQGVPHSIQALTQRLICLSCLLAGDLYSTYRTLIQSDNYMNGRATTRGVFKVYVVLLS